MIKVLVIDDSALMRQRLTQMLDTDDNIIVVGEAEDPYEARELIKQLSPDVLTLDVDMLKMDGLAFLRNLMRLRPMPVLMVSSLTKKAADITLEALSLGAIDYIVKPQNHYQNSLSLFQNNLVQKVTAAGQVSFDAPPAIRHHHAIAPPVTGKFKNGLIAIGASTGGIEAIQTILMALPANMPPIVITQHIQPVFSSSFVARLNQNCHLNVIEAQGGEKLTAGNVYIAPGDQHLAIEPEGNHFKTKLLNTGPVNRHKPSIDVLFNSVAEHAAQNSVGIILTGMGADGSTGLLAMKQKGAYTIAQDEASSLVWQMPSAAVAIEAASEVLPLTQISDKLLTLLTIS
ncbi:protein-glutamate methylesterase/protein-glutamine glutaminase [Shewanella glacialimarina]|uniref:protein-glutamate methylesterase/protein-glutamine glutaminase n=1 Tax=Shewanella glacialimarina TaxID=2590884 RepID=UPI001CF804E5|nr:chemotaxis response regulator protein-glutamate methylesterase [Shewanella glacialimarina]UCX06304.1 chemotaxis response regulator protein-glutamate methylesterase [Shewanella glacialimarina]